MKSQQGLTLIEMVIVIAILLTFLGVVGIRVNESIAINDLTSTADELAINIRTMQHLSLQKTRSGNDSVTMTFTASSYQINNLGTKLPVVNLPKYITLVRAENSPLTYDPYVFANNQASMITLKSQKTSQIRTIVICKETGRIRIDSSSSPKYKTEEQ